MSNGSIGGNGEGFFAWFFFMGLGVYMDWDLLVAICGLIGIFFVVGIGLSLGWKVWVPYVVFFVGMPFLVFACQRF